MTKFFLRQKGIQNGPDRPSKKKKAFKNCNESLATDIFGLLKKLLTREKQKTIRKSHETGEEQQKTKLQNRLLSLKSISKEDLKNLSYHILHQELNVDEESIKKITTTTLELKEEGLNEKISSFFSSIKNREPYKTAIEDFQKVRNQVNEKKHMKKEKAKLRKKSKIQHRKQLKEQNGDSQKEISEPKNINQLEQNDKQTNQEPKETTKAAVPKIKAQVPKKNKPINKIQEPYSHYGRTEFKKTGRNKAIQEKRDKKRPKFEPKQQSKVQQRSSDVAKPQTKFDRLNAGQTLHPSWQAMRQIKQQQFIMQPFQGKKILL